MIFPRTLLTLLCLFAPIQSYAQTIQTKAKQAIVLDYNTGTVLFEKNAQTQMPTSSMSKVITMYAVFEALKDGTLSLDDTFTVSEKAWRKGGSKMFVEVNKEVSIEDLVRGVVIQSGNDATIVIAEGISGSENAFAEKLNSIAARLGMEDSHFMNASGWPDPDHYSTATDLAKLAYATINNFPEYYKYYGEKEFTYNDITQPNRNPLLHQNIGADGMKTGHTDAGGYGLIGSAVAEDGRRVLIVFNGTQSMEDRAQEAKKLMTWGMHNFKNETVFKAGQIVRTIPVALGQKDSIDATLNEDFLITLPRNADRNIDISYTYNTPLKAPIEKGTEIGTLTVKSPGLRPVERKLYAAETVEQLGLFSRAIAKAKLLILGA